MNLLVSIAKRLNIIPVPFVDITPQICLARALLEANRLGLFGALEERSEGLTCQELAERAGISLEGATVLLTALDKSGYLTHRKGRYRNGPWSKRWIIGEKQGLPNFIKLLTNTWERLTDLETCLRTGRPTQDHHKEVEKHPEYQEIYTQAMRETARLLIPHLLKRVKLPTEAKKLLDIGGSHGDFSRALVRQFPGLKATVFDLALPIATAQRILDEEGNPEGIEFRVGDALKDDLGTGWDVVLLAQTIHVFNLDQNRELLLRIRKSLKPRGVVLVMDQFQGLGRLQDSIAGLISLAYFTVGGKSYHREEIIDLLKKAGFRRIEVKPFLLRSPTALIEGWK